MTNLSFDLNQRTSFRNSALILIFFKIAHMFATKVNLFVDGCRV